MNFAFLFAGTVSINPLLVVLELPLLLAYRNSEHIGLMTLWCRFKDGRPRKMLGYLQVSNLISAGGGGTSVTSNELSVILNGYSARSAGGASADAPGTGGAPGVAGAGVVAFGRLAACCPPWASSAPLASVSVSVRMLSIGTRWRTVAKPRRSSLRGSTPTLAERMTRVPSWKT